MVRLLSFLGFFVAVFLWAPLARAAGAAPAPFAVSRCVLETTQRVALAVDGIPKGTVTVGVRVGLYGKRGEWLADALFELGGLDVPIVPLAGFLDPRAVASVRCSVDGHTEWGDQTAFLESGESKMGQKTCPVPNSLLVDGGPDAFVDTVLAGPGWLLVRLQFGINHFFANQETAFAGDIFAVSVDSGAKQKIVIGGDDPQYASLLFTGLQHGLHQIDYGPWQAGDEGSHHFCLRT